MKAFSKSFGDLKKQTEELNKSLGGLNNTFKSLDKTLHAQMKNLTNFGKSFQSVNAAIKQSTGLVTQYTKALASMQQTSVRGAGGFNGGPPPRSPRGGAGGSGGGGMQILPAPGGGFVAIPGGQGGGGYRGGAANDNREVPQGGGFNWGMASRIANQVTNIGTRMLDYSQQKNLAPMQVTAQDQSLRGNMIKEQLGGDFSTANALYRYHLENGGRTDEKRKFSGRFEGVADKERAKGVLGSISDIIGGTASGSTGGPVGAIGGALLGGANGIGNQYVNEELGGNKLKEISMNQAGIQAIKDRDPFKGVMMSHIASTADMRLSANRRLGNQAAGAFGQAQGHGMSLGESLGFFQGGADKFGSNVMMGGLGRNALNMQRFGFNRDTMSNLMGGMQGNMAVSGMSNKAGTEQASKMMIEAVSTGVSKGIKDVQTLEALATAVAGASQSAQGFQDTSKLSASLTADRGPRTRQPAAN